MMLMAHIQKQFFLLAKTKGFYTFQGGENEDEWKRIDANMLCVYVHVCDSYCLISLECVTKSNLVFAKPNAIHRHTQNAAYAFFAKVNRSDRIFAVKSG